MKPRLASKYIPLMATAAVLIVAVRGGMCFVSEFFARCA